MKGKIIAVLNRKGGVGKTTTTLNFGYNLARKGHRVLLVDCDSQRNLTKALGLLDPDSSKKTICELMMAYIDDDAEVLTVAECILHSEAGVDYIPCKEALSTVETRMIQAIGREQILASILCEIKNEYDYILIDCSAALGQLIINSLVACDEVLLVSFPEPDSQEGLQLAMNFIRTVERVTHRKIPIAGILLCRVPVRGRTAVKITKKIKESFGEKTTVFNSEIPNRVAVVDASDKHRVIEETAPGSPAAKAYEAFCNEYLRRYAE